MENLMRPRIVRLPDGGEVIIKNVAPDKADEIKAYLLNTPTTSESGEATDSQDSSAKAASYTHKALGVVNNNGKLSVVVLNFDPVEGVGVVESTKEALDKYDSTMTFKKLAVEFDFV